MLLAGFAVMQAVQLRRITRERDRADRIAQFMTEYVQSGRPGPETGKPRLRLAMFSTKPLTIFMPALRMIQNSRPA